MSFKILVATPLLTKTGLASTGAFLSAQANQVIENASAKDLKGLQSVGSNGNDLSVFVGIGAILAFGTTVFVVCKVLQRSKHSAIPTDFRHPVPQKKTETLEYFTTDSNSQITPDAYIEKAYTCFRQGDIQKAIAEFNHAIVLHSHDANLYIERANFRRKNLEDKLGALEDYTQAIHLHPNKALFYLWRSQLYYEIGDNVKAMADHNTAMRLAPEDTMYHLFQSNITSPKR
jgi:tetratricopeptide (TPR) repeat protein